MVPASPIAVSTCLIDILKPHKELCRRLPSFIQLKRPLQRQALEDCAKRRRWCHKKVRFAEDQNTVRIRHLSIEDLQQTWMQPNDYGRIKKEAAGTLCAIMGANGCISNLDIDVLCLRGLEAALAKAMCHIKINKQRHFSRTVVKYQRAQEENGTLDADALSAFASSFSEDDRLRALQLARVDACIYN